MKLLSKFAVATAAVSLATAPIAAQAVERVEAPVVEESELGALGGIGPAFIIIALVAAGMIALLVSDDDDDDAISA